MSNHGTGRRYKQGCRCEDCRAAKADELREYRSRRKAQTGLAQKRRPSRTYMPRLPCSVCGEPMSARTPVPTHKRCNRHLSLSVERRRAIYERDDWNCGFCGYGVDPELSGADPFGPTLDHIVPRSLGGSDDETNLRLVHRYCNTARSNRAALTIDRIA